MQAVKNRGVKSTELALRARLVAAGLRGWRMYVDSLPGTPDFVFEKKNLVVFVHGCFWHGCPRCYRRPHSRQTYWDEKVARNRSRDRAVTRMLRKAGWRIMRIWECQLTPKKQARVLRRLQKLLLASKSARGKLGSGNKSRRVSVGERTEKEISRNGCKATAGLSKWKVGSRKLERAERGLLRARLRRAREGGARGQKAEILEGNWGSGNES